jgi:hypothetical protein
MKKIIADILLLAATAALSSCVVDKGGNHNLNTYRLREAAGFLVDRTTVASVFAINQMVLDGRDINAEGFTGRAGEGILFVRTDQDCWEVTGGNEYVEFTLTLLREPGADGYDSWICRDLQCLHDEKGSGCAKMAGDGDIVFEWITQTNATQVNSRLEQSGVYRVDFYADQRAAARTDWCTLTYTAGVLSFDSSLGSPHDVFFYE